MEFVYAIKNKPEQVFIRLQEHDPIDVCIFSVTYSVVIKDIPAGVVAAGNPCRVIRKITEKDRLDLRQ